MSNSADVIVIGAGLSGLMAGVQAARRGLRVIVLEARPLVGAKFCYTSMGAAAVSSTKLDVTRFRGRNARFVDDALKAFGPGDLAQWFGDAGVALKSGPHYGLVRPAQNGADVVSALVDALEQAGAKLMLESTVDRLTQSGSGFAVTGRGFAVSGKTVVLACGGPNLPQLGGDMGGITMAVQLGHTVEPVAPAHVGITVADDWTGALAGLWMDVELKLLAGKRSLAQAQGSMLFTSGALTGEAVFNISGEVSPALSAGEALTLCVNFHPDLAQAEVAQWLHRVFGERTRELAEKALDYIVPQRLGALLLQRHKHKHGIRVMQLDERHRLALLEDMTSLRLDVTGTLGMRAAESARGGISLREIDPRTFASRKVRGLYVVGRVLDVAADWGGHEQHFALASGFVAGCEISIEQ